VRDKRDKRDKGASGVLFILTEGLLNCVVDV